MEKAVNRGGHREHGVKATAYADFPDHPLGGQTNSHELKLFAVPAVFAVVELRF